MSTPYNDPTEYISAIHSQPTQPLRAHLVPKAYVPGYLWSDQEEWEQEQANKARPRETLQALESQRESLFAWEPIIIFVMVFVSYLGVLWVCAMYASNAWQWGR